MLDFGVSFHYSWLFKRMSRRTARVSRLAGEPTHETEKCVRLDSTFLPGPPASPLHLGMMGDHHFPRKNVFLSTQDLSQNEPFIAQIVHFRVTF